MDYQKAILDKVSTGLKLRKIRCESALMEKKLKNGIDGEDLAVLLQLKSPRVIYDWESGMKIPNAENLYNLALIFNMKMEDLLVMR